MSDKFSGEDLYIDRVYYRLSWAWKETGNIYIYIYGYYHDSLALILDDSLSFKYRIDLIEQYLHPLSGFFENNYTSTTFWRTLTETGEVSNLLAERLKQHINIIIETWVRCCDANVIIMISILKCIDGFESVFDRLKRQISESTNMTISLFKLLLTCLELDEDKTLNYLGIDRFFPFFIGRELSSFNRRSSHILKRRSYQRDIGGITAHFRSIGNHNQLAKVLSALR